MSWKTSVRDAAAAAAKAVLASVPGESVSYSQKSGTAITGLKAFPGKTEVTFDYLNDILCEIKKRRFYIPKQTGSAAFPPTNGPNIGDVISYDSISWVVTGFSVDSIDAGYNVDTEAAQASKAGVE